MVDEIDQERVEEIVADPFLGEQEVNVEQVAGVLATERGRDLPGIQVGLGHELHLGEAEAILDAALTDLSSGGNTVPRNTGNTSILIVTPSDWTTRRLPSGRRRRSRAMRPSLSIRDAIRSRPSRTACSELSRSATGR